MKFIEYEDRIYNLDQLNFIRIGSYELILQFKTNPSDCESIFYLSSRKSDNELSAKLFKIIEFIKNNEVLLELTDCMNHE